MKILSWNVNGLSACIKRGFIPTINKLRADVVCLQETKLNEDMELDIPYRRYWNFSPKKGYAGVAIFSKFNPLNVTHGINQADFDDEGRVLTLEFSQFFLVNVYVPNSQSGLRRREYRRWFDYYFQDFIIQLQERKPVVICGDFNVAHTDADVYEGNEINERYQIGFQSQEREQFGELLDLGFVDVFRNLYPDEIEYTWWSNRLGKRFENKGWRIDYFLVSATHKEYITKFVHHKDIYGSDHCPIEMHFNEWKIGVDAITDYELAEQWNTIDWATAEESLLDMQRKLTKAAFVNNTDRIVEMQKKIVRCKWAKCLAVRHVTNTSSGPGIDGIKWTTPAEKMRAALLLTSQGYKAQPCRHIVLQSKNNTKERRISIPTMYDRAMQVLYGYALSPIAEATGERKSFAFRKGRSLQDVHAFMMDCLSGVHAPRYVLITDVKSYYGKISHEWLMKNIPMDKTVLGEFLKAGYVFAGSLFPTEEGISLGSNISPILGNMTLDGMQKYIYDEFYKDGEIDYGNGNLIRFADDIIINARSQKDAERFKEIIQQFLAERGLRMSEDKTKIVDVYDGFDYLSRHYERKGNVIYSCPSQGAVNKFEGILCDFILTYKGSQQSLIESLNKKLRGFANYHRVTEAMEAFRHLDVAVNAYLLELCRTKHPKMARRRIIDRYWYKRSDGHFVYALKDKIECQVIRLSDTLLITPQRKLKTNANPYLETDYFENRNDTRDKINVSGKYKSVWQRQQGRCYYCNQPILADHAREVVLIDTSELPHINNLAYIHKACEGNEFLQLQTSDYDNALYGSDIMSLLKRLERNEEQKMHQPFDNLGEYFLNTETTPITLKFGEIEKIMGAELCASAYKYPAYWYKDGEGNISQCWKNNGYIIQQLHITQKYVVFRKADTSLLKVKIPEVFLTQKIPMDAKYEVENYLEYIRKKYGL